MPTKIRYNGTEIAIVAAGETKILECSGKKMRSNVAVEVESGGEDLALQSKSVTPTEAIQEVTADEGYTALEKVTVAPIPDEYIIPSGDLAITENGTFDVTQYASAEVNVPSEEPILEEITITENGEYTPSGDGYSKVTVEVEAEDSAVPTEVSTEAEMTALLESGEVGGVYKYTGETGTYENGALYVLEEDPLVGTWLFHSFNDFNGLRGSRYLITSATAYTNPIGCLKYPTDFSISSELSVVEFDCSRSFSGKYVGLVARNLVDDHTDRFMFGRNGSISTVMFGNLDTYVEAGRTTLEIYNTIQNVDVNPDFLTWLQANATKQKTNVWWEKLSGALIPQITAPVLSLNGDTLTITEDSGLATSFDVLVDDVVVGNTTSGTFDLSTLGLNALSLIRAVSKATGCYDSVQSSSIIYGVGTENAIVFNSESSFTLKVDDNKKYWDGCLNYSTDANTWNIWDGTALSADSGSLYLAGADNTFITGSKRGRWVLTGSAISCSGNIENLLDCATVANGEHPTMANYCYAYMFDECTSLTMAPELPATILANYCYQQMFHGCTALTTAPDLPATTLANYCYAYMFSGCTNLTTTPELPATILAKWCYDGTFEGCTGLTTTPGLPATKLAYGCYRDMFNSCTSLTIAPELPATTLEGDCYYGMFYDCTSLIAVPGLPATTLDYQCYRDMFNGCTALTTAPDLPATTLANGCYYSMFEGCTGLTIAPELPVTALDSYCYRSMFKGCTSLTAAPALPATTLANGCYYQMFSGCTNIKLSAEQTDEYTVAYRIPTSGEGITATDALTEMFTDTGGTFTGTPSINTTYYLHNSNSVV